MCAFLALFMLLLAVPSSAQLWSHWSQKTTWPNRAVPAAGSSVVIPANKTIVLDVITPKLKGLTIFGNLVAAPGATIGITSDFILVQGGTFQIGTSTAPFAGRATITLTGNTTRDLFPPLKGLGAKVLAVNGGKLELQGALKTSWSRLSSDVSAGSRTITLSPAPIGWKAGDEIVIATSDFDQAHYDLAVIQSVSGSTVALSSSLKCRHFGSVKTVGDIKIDVRAEVGLLSHNIVVQGDGLNPRIGGHAIFVSPANKRTTVQISGVEFRRMGQFNQLGRYPVHFHKLEDRCRNCYIRDSSVHDSIQRGIVIHSTRNMTVRNNVVFNTVGHNIVIEDEMTTGNTIEGNLVLVNSQPKPLFTEATLRTQNDRMPSNFWFKSTANVVRGNAAAGSFDNGFNYDGVSPRVPIDFRDNVAHAAMAQEGVSPGDFDIFGGLLIVGAGHLMDRIDRFLAYHNEFGIWAEDCDHFCEDCSTCTCECEYKIRNFLVAENRNGVFNRGVSNRLNYINGTFVKNFVGGDPSSGPGTFGNAIAWEYGSIARFDSPTFANYEDANQLFSGGHAALRSQLTWIHRNVHWVGTRPSFMYSSEFGVTTSEDDSFLPKGSYVDDAAYAHLGQCSLTDFKIPDGDEGQFEIYQSYRCPRRYFYAELDTRDMVDPGTRIHDKVPIFRSDGYNFTGGMFGYTTIVDANLSYELNGTSAAGYSFRLNSMADDGRWTAVDAEKVWLPVSVKVPAAPKAVFRTTDDMEGPPAPKPQQLLKSVDTLAALQADPLGSYFYDVGTKAVRLMASIRWVTVNF